MNIEQFDKEVSDLTGKFIEDMKHLQDQFQLSLEELTDKLDESSPAHLVIAIFKASTQRVKRELADE